MTFALMKAMAAEIVPVIREFVGLKIAPLSEKNTELEARVAKLEAKLAAMTKRMKP